MRPSSGEMKKDQERVGLDLEDQLNRFLALHALVEGLPKTYPGGGFT